MVQLFMPVSVVKKKKKNGCLDRYFPELGSDLADYSLLWQVFQKIRAFEQRTQFRVMTSECVRPDSILPQGASRHQGE